ncbi:MAG: zinc ribbon domain-containing protein [Deltaproteobacteria bacterium]|nr:zinc ribbon domain-containing protein [Deltaproteobacteria bacterium]
MPLYEYRCTACATVFEHLQGPEEPDPSTSPCCGAPVERLLSAAAPHRNLPPRASGRTCCGREERCETPPCQGTGRCER